MPALPVGNSDTKQNKNSSLGRKKGTQEETTDAHTDVRTQTDAIKRGRRGGGQRERDKPTLILTSTAF